MNPRIRSITIQILGASVLLIVAVALMSAFIVSSSSAPSSERSEVHGTRQTIPSLSLVEWDWKRTNYGSLFIVGTVQNNSARRLSVTEVRFNLYDKNGALVGNASTSVSDLEPFGVWKFKALVMDDEHVRTASLKELRAW